MITLATASDPRDPYTFWYMSSFSFASNAAALTDLKVIKKAPLSSEGSPSLPDATTGLRPLHSPNELSSRACPPTRGHHARTLLERPEAPIRKTARRGVDIRRWLSPHWVPGSPLGRQWPVPGSMRRSRGKLDGLFTAPMRRKEEGQRNEKPQSQSMFYPTKAFFKDYLLNKLVMTTSSWSSNLFSNWTATGRFR